MKITHLKTNHIVNPLGFAIETPTFAWIVEETPDPVQTAAQVRVSRDADFEQIVFDSGKVAGAGYDSGIDSLAYRPPLDLAPRTRYFWKVRVWGETERAESEVAWFETAKRDEGWQAVWITPDWEDNQLHPILYRQFDLPARAVTARAYVCGLGLYHFELNGQKVGDEIFTPYCNAYDQWIQYQTFDITDQLTVGANRVAVMLGNGWYKGRYGANGGSVDFYGDRFVLIAELRVTLEDGSEHYRRHRFVVALAALPGDREQHLRRRGLRRPHPAQSCPRRVKSSRVKPIAIDMARLEARRSLPVGIVERSSPSP